MISIPRYVLRIGAVFLLLLLPITSAAAAQELALPKISPMSRGKSTSATISRSVLWETPNPTPPPIQTLLEAVKGELAALPPESKEETVEQKRTLLQTQLALLEEFLEAVERRQTLKISGNDWPAQEKKLAAAIAQEEKKIPPTPPEQPTPEIFKQIENSMNMARTAVEKLTVQAKERQRLMEQIPGKIVKAKEQMKQAKEDRKKFQELASKAEGNNKQLLSLQVENAHILEALAHTQSARWADEQSFAMATVAFQDRQLEMAQIQYQYQQKTFALYQTALNSHQAEAVTIRQNELVRTEQAAQEASGPDQKFLAYWDTENARLQKNIADLDKLLTEIVSAISEQEKLLQNEKDEMKNLVVLIQQFGTQNLATGILEEHFKRLSLRRQGLRKPLYPKILEQIAGLQTRMFSINTAMSELGETWETAKEAIELQLDEQNRSNFGKQAKQRRDDYRLSLSAEKRALLDVQSGGQRLQLLALERTEALHEMETFFFSRVFWIQDAPPVGLEMINQLFSEILSPSRHDSLLNGWRRVLAPEVMTQLFHALHRPAAILLGVLLLFLLPVFLYRIRRQLRRYVQESNQKILGNKKPSPLHVGPLLAVLLAPALGPLYLLSMSILIGQVLTLPEAIATILHQSLILLASFWFLWLFNNQIFGPGGFAETEFHLPPDVTQSLLRSVAISLLAYLVFLPVWAIFREPPFQYEALPRIGYTLFEWAAAYAFYRLIHHNAPLPSHAFAMKASATPEEIAGKPHTEGFLKHYWRLISRLLALFMAIVLLLDIAGYRFGAAHLAYNGIRTVVTFFLLIGIYRAMTTAVEEVIRRRRRLPTVLAPGARGTQTRSQIAQQINNSLRMLFTLAGLFLMSSYWGINEQAFAALKSLTLYSTVDNGQVIFVTLADFLNFFFCLFAVGWTVNNLPRIYELLLFPRLQLDAGARYAALTISRYLIFIFGFLLALNFLHLDIAKLGWLVAAISVGIGFGLQEIVANFVSGIILLLERPIRVGDTITVGAITGDVTRINIRATTVLNMDYQEILIPNRDLITKEVTNWTLANTVVRVVIRIGVAYGSDIILVRKLLTEMAQQQPEILKTPPSAVFFVNHGESSLDFELRIFLPTPTLRMPMIDRLNSLINTSFAQHAIEIPFPQRDLHIRTPNGAGLS